MDIMDIENFQQCLSYIEYARPAKNSLEKIIAVGGTLAGAALGFALNYFHAKSKESRSTKNKLMCCDEDVHRIRAYLTMEIKEVLRLNSKLVSRKPLIDYRLQDSISTLLIDEYFPEVAHKFSRNQRYWLQELLNNLKIVNSMLSEIKEGKRIGKPYEMTLSCLSFIDSAAFSSYLCTMILSNTVAPRLTTVEFLQANEFDSSFVQDYSLAESNALHENKEFCL